LLDTKLQDRQSSQQKYIWSWANVPGDKSAIRSEKKHHLGTLSAYQYKSASFSSLLKLLKISSFYMYKILLPVPAILISDGFLLKLSIPELLLYTFVHLTQSTSTNLLSWTGRSRVVALYKKHERTQMYICLLWGQQVWIWSM
jgi:hypothetical protein